MSELIEQCNGEPCEAKTAYRNLFNNRAARVQDLQRKVWEAMDRVSFPGAYMALVSDKILEFGCAEIADLKKKVEQLTADIAALSNQEAGQDMSVEAAMDEWFGARSSLRRTVGNECAFGGGFDEAIKRTHGNQKPFAYGCPAGCGCLWRDNEDGTMSLFGASSISCNACESQPLQGLVKLYLYPPKDMAAAVMDRVIHVGYTNPHQIEYGKESEGKFYPDTENDCVIPLYMLKVHLHRLGRHVSANPPPATPEGYMQVPADVSSDMWAAGRKAFVEMSDKVRYSMRAGEACAYQDLAPQAIWTAMISALRGESR